MLYKYTVVYILTIEIFSVSATFLETVFLRIIQCFPITKDGFLCMTLL